ncbi:RecQ family ATP-dependent DNA helicase [Mariniflexile sp.]|uniref:RecQ family ATP-dependent DNA helicase n=1 Tax=Mariniflexile sp. TaxID=1979402 RepID=UPI004048DB38
MDKQGAVSLLRKALNIPGATFRDGQWEAIEKLTVDKEKLLVIQRTGWGKSSVYFISSRILRDQGKGPTIIISPLLALMRNQIEAAERLGIKAVTINSNNFDDWKVIQNEVLKNNVDTLLISPERLANERFMDEILFPIADKIGLFVVDEAHCISDWGHDFRPDYRRIVGILKVMPKGMPVLGTTATANDRVVADIEEQLGGINVLRGALTRESLKLQNIVLKDQASRLAWLKENLPNLDGSGIIYVLTKRDARTVVQWLNDCNIEAAAYYSGVEDDNFEDSTTYREFLEDSLYNNDLKVLVATTALAMGYDKPDLNFVIHFQAPDSIISYYQQVGRAGRAIDSAYGILLSGQEDAEVHNYFRESAFPPEYAVQNILQALEDYDGLSIPKLQEVLNLSYGKINQTIKYLSVEEPSPIIKVGTQWKRSAVSFAMDKEKIERLTNQRELEWNIVQDYIITKECLMSFLQRELDDQNITNCGKCGNCLGKAIVPDSVSHSNTIEASIYLKHSEFDILPRKQIAKNALPEYDWRGNLREDLQAEKGKVLSRWGDAGWGNMVTDDKHSGYFRDELVDAMYEMIVDRWKPNPFPEWLTCIPSLRHPELVPNFAKRLAEKLGIPFKPLIVKAKDTKPQKDQENSFHQCHNLDGVFQIEGEVENKPVFLVDDAVDSRWTTFTIATTLLKKSGSGLVYPIALTSTSVSD